MKLKIEVYGKSDVGMVRAKNEDSMLIDEDLGLYIVADGMGGHVGGKMASSLAVKRIPEYLKEHLAELDKEVADMTSLETTGIPRILADAVRSACATIYQTAIDDPSLQGMGTTCTSLLVRNNTAFFAHVGDSRAYLQRGNAIVQITEDHSLVNEQIKAGILTPEQARVSNYKNIITRSVGFEKDVAVDTFALPLEHNDKFLMCSDGLANYADDLEMGRALAYSELKEVPAMMVDLANSRGGSDNITCVVVKALDMDQEG